MRDLNYELRNLCRRNHDGAHQTRADRERMLMMMADQLRELGFRRMNAGSLKPKHVEALIKRWQNQGTTIGTLKNRLSAIRWWAEKVNKQNVVARSNAYYGIPDRQFVTNISKAKELPDEALSKVTDANVRMSLELQRAFGLRREEAIKFSPFYADGGDQVRLKPTWCKGGRGREVPIRSEQQREVLNRALRIAGRGSLIPPDRTYIAQLRIYERQTVTADLSKMHGLRHLYAQERYKELTGWNAPAAGGPTRRTLTASQREVDEHARLTISQELGHNRSNITSVYLGK